MRAVPRKELHREEALNWPSASRKARQKARASKVRNYSYGQSTHPNRESRLGKRWILEVDVEKADKSLIEHSVDPLKNLFLIECQHSVERVRTTRWKGRGEGGRGLREN